jgi:hypothetical protein
VFRVTSIGVVDILDVDVFGGAADAIVCLDVIDIQAGYNGSLNESYNKTSSFSLAGLVGIGSLYTSTEDCQWWLLLM